MPLFRRGAPPFSLKTLQKDANCALVQDPSAFWGSADHLPRRNLLNNSVMWGGTTAPTNWSYFGTANNSAATGAFTSAGAAIWRSSAVAARDHLGVTTSTLQANTVYEFSIIIHTIHSGAPVATAVALLANLPTGATVTFLPCSANPDGGSLGVIRPGTLILQLTIASTAGTVGVRCGVGTNNAVTADVSYSSPMLVLASTVNKEFQAITDWTTEQSAWAAQKNVPWLRKNRLVNTRFAGAVAGTPGTAPTSWAFVVSGGSVVSISGGVLRYSASVNRQFSAQVVTGVVGQTYTLRAYVTVHSGNINAASQLLTCSTAASSTAYWNGAVITGFAPVGERGLLEYVFVSSNVSMTVRFGVGTSSNSTADVSFEEIQVLTGDRRGASYQAIDTTWDVTYTALAQAASYPTAMYSDRVGTVAVTGPDTVIGAILDQSRGLAGAEKGRRNRLANAVFAGAVAGTPGTFPTSWSNTGTTNGSIVSLSNEALRVSAVSGFIILSQDATTVEGAVYQCSVWVTVHSGSLQIRDVLLNDLLSSNYRLDGVSVADTTVLTASDTPRFVQMQITANSTSTQLRCGICGKSSTTLTADVTIYQPMYCETGILDETYQRTTTATAGWIDGGSVPGNHAVAPSDAARPILRLDGNGKYFIQRDLSDDNLPITFANLGTNNSTYVAENATTVTQADGVTINGATNFSTPATDYGRVVVTGGVPKYSAKLVNFLKKKAGG